MVSLLRFRHFDERLVSESDPRGPPQGSVNPAALEPNEDVDDLMVAGRCPDVVSPPSPPASATPATTPSVPVLSVSALPNPATGILQAANYVMDVSRSMAPTRFPTQTSSQRRDQLGQPLLNASASQASIPAASNDAATPDDGDLGDGHQDPARPRELSC